MFLSNGKLIFKIKINPLLVTSIFDDKEALIY